MGNLNFRSPGRMKSAPKISAGHWVTSTTTMAEVTTKKRKRTGKQREEAKKAAIVSVNVIPKLTCRRKLRLRRAALRSPRLRL